MKRTKNTSKTGITRPRLKGRRDIRRPRIEVVVCVVYVSMYVRIYIRTYVYTYVCMYEKYEYDVCMYVHTYIYI